MKVRRGLIEIVGLAVLLAGLVLLFTACSDKDYFYTVLPEGADVDERDRDCDPYEIMCRCTLERGWYTALICREDRTEWLAEGALDGDCKLYASLPAQCPAPGGSNADDEGGD